MVLLALLGLFAVLAFASSASAETRTLKLYFTHTREKAEITYKRNGRYLQDGLNQINRFLRDWRRNESTKMDPRLLDLLWETYRATGSREYIHVVSAYRSPATNEMLRKRSSGVATKSQHMLGKAIDFYIPGVKLATLRKIGLSLHGGGVGFYPKSGSPFVHLDIGNVRHWPRMSRRELLAMFPDGKTLHVPSDGKPLPGYQQALAAYKKRGSSSPVVVASANEATRSKKSGGFLAALFRGGADQDEDEAESTAVSRPAAPQPAAARTVAAKAEPEVDPETPAMLIASLPATAIPLPRFAPRAMAEPVAAESAMPEATIESIVAAAGDPVAEEVVALNVPFPTPRPSDGLEAIAAVVKDGSTGIEEAEAILQASIGGAIPATLSFVPQPAPRSNENGLPPVLTALAPIETPSSASIALAAMQGSNIAGPEPEETLSPEALRQHVLASLATPEGPRPLQVSARTTSKAPRPSSEDVKGQRKALIVPMPDHLSRRAFIPRSISEVVTQSKVPSFAFTPNNAAPREVYTAGFSMELPQAQPDRFTGSAVTFLSIARFN